MREYKTQMEAARKGIVTEELKKVAQKETLACGRVDASGGSRKGCHLRK